MRRLPTRSAWTLVLLGLGSASAAPASLASASRPTAPWGPPTLCHPIELVDLSPEVQRTLDLLEDEKLVAEAPARVLGLLEREEDLLVHMEGLRRTILSIMGLRVEKERGALARELRRGLEGRRDDLLERVRRRESVTEAELGRVWFDLGYARAGLRDAGLERGSPVAELKEALERLPQEGAVHLGAALARWVEFGFPRPRLKHLADALELCHDPREPLALALVSTAGSMMDQRSLEALREHVRSQRSES